MSHMDHLYGALFLSFLGLVSKNNHPHLGKQMVKLGHSA